MNIITLNATAGLYTYDFTIDDGSEVEVYFEKQQKSDSWYMEFSRDYNDPMISKYKATGTGDAWRVYATVIEVTRDFIQHANPDIVYFSAMKEEQSRVKLYDKMVKRFANQMGYELQDINSQSQEVVYTLKRKS